MGDHRRAAWALAALLLGLCVFDLTAQVPGPRHALVIGNAEYTGMPRLRNPANDARAVGDVLGVLGFAVTPLYNGTRKQMNQAIMAFREALAADRASEGFFYFAGHGVQAKGVNYLVPVGSDIRSEADLDDEAVSLQRVLGNIEEAHNRVNVVVIDACRDNPLPAASRSAARGLAVVASAPPESVVLFSTAQNQTAADGDGANSPFALALVKYLSEPGDISRTVKLVTAEVKRATGSAQTPFQYTSLDFDYNLNRSAVAGAATPLPATVAAPSADPSATKAAVKAPKLGDSFAGGLVFFLDGKGGGLVAAPADQGTGLWSDGNYIQTGATATGVGTGKPNTAAIVSKQDAADNAASICDNLVLGGFDDWFLPSKDELDLMYRNLKKQRHGGFAPEWYWSSSEDDNYFSAWMQRFDDGRQSNDYAKDNYFRVRAVRAF